MFSDILANLLGGLFCNLIWSFLSDEEKRNSQDVFTLFCTLLDKCRTHDFASEFYSGTGEVTKSWVVENLNQVQIVLLIKRLTTTYGLFNKGFLDRMFISREEQFMKKSDEYVCNTFTPELRTYSKIVTVSDVAPGPGYEELKIEEPLMHKGRVGCVKFKYEVKDRGERCRFEFKWNGWREVYNIHDYSASRKIRQILYFISTEDCTYAYTEQGPIVHSESLEKMIERVIDGGIVYVKRFPNRVLVGAEIQYEKCALWGVNSMLDEDIKWLSTVYSYIPVKERTVKSVLACLNPRFLFNKFNRSEDGGLKWCDKRMISDFGYLFETYGIKSGKIDHPPPPRKALVNRLNNRKGLIDKISCLGKKSGKAGVFLEVNEGLSDLEKGISSFDIKASQLLTKLKSSNEDIGLYVKSWGKDASRIMNRINSCRSEVSSWINFPESDKERESRSLFLKELVCSLKQLKERKLTFEKVSFPNGTKGPGSDLVLRDYFVSYINGLREELLKENSKMFSERVRIESDMVIENYKAERMKLFKKERKREDNPKRKVNPRILSRLNELDDLIETNEKNLIDTRLRSEKNNAKIGLLNIKAEEELKKKSLFEFLMEETEEFPRKNVLKYFASHLKSAKNWSLSTCSSKLGLIKIEDVDGPKQNLRRVKEKLRKLEDKPRIERWGRNRTLREKKTNNILDKLKKSASNISKSKNAKVCSAGESLGEIERMAREVIEEYKSIKVKLREGNYIKPFRFNWSTHRVSKVFKKRNKESEVLKEIERYSEEIKDPIYKEISRLEIERYLKDQF